MTRTPFVLRSPNGPHAGQYVERFNTNHSSKDFGPVWTADVAKAQRFSVRDAYGNVACAIDMMCEVLAPENVGGATEEECREFGRIAANDMLQKPQATTVEMFEQWAVRRSSDDPLIPLPDEMKFEHKDGYMSVWEWIGRVVMLRLPREAQPC